MVAVFFATEELFRESIPFLEQGLDLDTVREDDELEADLAFLLGQAYERTGAYERAGSAFRRVLELEPLNGDALNYLGYMWADLGQNLDEALNLIRQAVDIEPNNGAYVDSLGWVLFRRGDLSEAQVELERAVELVPEDSTILEHLGDVYQALGTRCGARDAYLKALSINNDDNADQVKKKLSGLDRD